MTYYRYRHVHGEVREDSETVHFVNPLRWQDQCRQTFLFECAAEAIHRLDFITHRVSCEFLDEITTSDEIELRMQLKDMSTYKMELAFDFYRQHVDGRLELCARSNQELSCVQRVDGETITVPIPEAIRQQLMNYSII